MNHTVPDPEPVWAVKHPWFSVTAACLLLFFFGFCETGNLRPGSYLYAGAVLLLFLARLAFRVTLFKSAGKRWLFFLYASACMITALVLIYANGHSTALMLWLFLLMPGMYAILLYSRGQLDDRRAAALLIAAGIMLRFVYILYTDSGSRQHDVNNWSGNTGHAGYILYWFQNGLKLPDFDIRTRWQYYQPPLHHWLMALTLRLFTGCGMEFITACEALQVLPFLYACLILVVCERLFRQVGLDGLPLVTAMAIVCFHPTFVLMGGSFGNDLLSVLFMLLTLLFALRWYEEPTMRRILPIAFSIGLGMMAKLSAWMAAPAVALLFLVVLIRSRESWKSLLAQFVLFGLICIPLGLWWQIRNYAAFDVPLTYIPRLPMTNPQYCGNLSAAKRLFDFGGDQLRFVYFALTMYGAPYCEFNPTLGLFKSALFDECVNGVSALNFPAITVTGPILFWTGTALGLLSFGAFVFVMMRRGTGLDGVRRAFFTVFALTLLLCFYLFCFAYPYACTMNIRYCAALIPVFAMGLGLLLKHCAGGSPAQRVLRYVSVGLAALFAFISCMVYTQIG